MPTIPRVTRRRPGARGSRAILAALAVLTVGLLPVRLALAHAELVRSEPAANTSVDVSPPRIQLWFSEPIDPSFAEAQILDRTGSRIDAGASAVSSDDPLLLTLSLNRPLPKGTYAVSWKVLSSVDGHITRGAFAFGVGEVVTAGALVSGSMQVPPVSPLQVVTRWLALAGGLAASGGFFFLLAVWIPAAPQLRSALREGPAAMSGALVRIRLVVLLGLASLAVGSFGLLAVQAADLGEGSVKETWTALLQLITGTRLGTVWLARIAFAAVLLAVVVRGVRPGRALRVVAWSGTVVGALILLTFSLTGHGGAIGAQPGVNVLVDWGHLLGAASWVGGLAHLAVLLPLLLSSAERSPRAVLVVLLARFSTLALSGCVLLAATGLYNAVLHIPDLQALSDTQYGNGVTAKILALLLLGVFGAANLLLLIPRMTGDAAASGGPWWPRFFRGMVMAELALGMMALAATAVITSTVPSRQAVALPGFRPWEDEQRAGDLRIRLSISPFEPGFSSFAVALQDRRGLPAEAQRVTLRVTMLDHEMGVQEAQTTNAGPGLFRGGGSYLSMLGRWQLEVLVRRDGLDDARAVFLLEVPAIAPGKLAAQTIPEVGIGGSPIVAAELAGLGLLLMVIAWRTGGAGRRSGVMALGLAAAPLLAAGFIGAVAQLGTISTAASATVQNPYPADGRSLAVGQPIYQQQCLICHGASGRGDGPAAAGLRPRPADFEVHLRAGHTDAQLFGWITGGVPGTAMPAMRDRLTEAERWHVLNYLKALVNVSDR